MEQAAKYAYEVYQKKSFSQAAEALFISQPALSAMVAKLERELGFPLFERTRGSAVTLTPKGQIYMDMLEEVRASEETMKKRLAQYGRTSIKRLRIGTMMHVAQFLIPDAARRFHQIHPDILIDLNMGNVGPHGVLHDKLKNGKLDLMLSYRAEERFESLPILTDRYLIVMRRDLVGAEALAPYALSREEILARQYTEDQEISDLSLFAPVPFITNIDASSRSKLSDILGAHYSFSSVSISDSRSSGMHYKLVTEGMGALLTTDVLLLDPLFDRDDMLYLLPKSAAPYRMLYVLWRKGEPLSEPVGKMIEILEDVCHTLPPFPQKQNKI